MGYSPRPSHFAYSSEPMNDRRKKLKFRAWRRGFREIDLILGGFADRHIAELDESALDAFESLLDAPDQEVYEWVTEQAPAPRDHDTPVLASIRAFRFELTKPPG